MIEVKINKERMNKMLLNKKCVYLGVSLFSAMILGTVSTQNVKAATTDPSNTTTTQSSTGTSTSSSSTTTGTTVLATTGTTSGTTSTAPTTSSSTTSGTTSTAPTTSSTTSTAPTTSSSTTSGTTSTAPTTSSSTTSGTTSTAPTTSSSTTSGTTSTVNSTSTITTTTQPVNSTTSTTGTGTTTAAATGTTTGTTTTPSTTSTTSTATVDPYAIPSNITDSTVVNFTDPLLENVVKYGLNIPTNQNITVGDIKSYAASNVRISQTTYQLEHPNGPDSTVIPGSSMTDQQDTPIESLDGMQYLQLLPAKTSVSLQVDLAADPKANEDLTPLDDLNFQSVAIDGNYSDPNAQEVNVNQVNDLNLSNADYVELTGDSKVSVNSGLNDAELTEIAPTLNKFANNGQSSHMIELGQAQITDFTPLQGTETGNAVTIVSAPDTIGDAKPIFAVDNQPISFTAPKVLGLTGTDIANAYHFTYNVPKAQLADDDLTNLGNDNYVLNTPNQGASDLVYGNIGWAYSANPDAYVSEKAGNTTFDAIINNIEPLLWQATPTVTINYEDTDGDPITVDGAKLSRVIDGTTIGSIYDLTGYSKIAGYDLVSPASVLKGSYTQDPQVVNLIYAPIPASNENTVPVQPVTTTTAIPNTGEAVVIQDVNGNTTGGAYLTDIGVKATTTINGKEFYELGSGEFVEADDYDAVTSTTPGEVRTFGTKEGLVDVSGNPIDVDLSPNTAWKYDKIVSIKGKGYYQVATNEFLPVSSGVDFTPATRKCTVSMTTRGTLYNSQGQVLESTLPTKSTWASDGIAIINGVKMYRVATDEFVSADNAKATEPVTTQYHASQRTILYNQDGQVISATLPANTDWKVDQIFYINGQEYYRVATNEYVKVA